jgi:hypothetical protein
MIYVLIIQLEEGKDGIDKKRLFLPLADGGPEHDGLYRSTFPELWPDQHQQ